MSANTSVQEFVDQVDAAAWRGRHEVVDLPSSRQTNVAGFIL